jgi:hypothetical protein
MRVPGVFDESAEDCLVRVLGAPDESAASAA